MKKKYLVILIGLLVIVSVAIYTLTQRGQSTQARVHDVRGPLSIDRNKNSDIIVELKNNLPPNVQDSLYVMANPGVGFTKTWETPKQLALSPTTQFIANTVYTLNIYQNSTLIYTYTFKTPAYSQEEIANQLREQELNDIAFNENMNKLLDEYPWYYEFPIFTESYTIVYDFEVEKFRIALQIPSSSLENEKTTLINAALEEFVDIENLTITTENYYITYKD